MTNPVMNNIPAGNTITVNGAGRISAAPDVAVLRLGVQTNGFHLEEIQTNNAALSTALLQAIQQLGITDITTYQYIINRVFDYQDGNQIDAGYAVRNIFEIKTNDIAKVGSIIDTAVRNGANVVDFINFDVSDRNSFYLLALNQAVANAYDKARSITNSLGIALNPLPLSITENSSTPIPLQAISYRGELTTPVEASNIQIDANVTIVFQIS